MENINEYLKFTYFHSVMYNRRYLPILKKRSDYYVKKIKTLERQVEIILSSSKKKKRRSFSTGLLKAADIWAKKIKNEKELLKIIKDISLIKNYEEEHKEIIKNCTYFLN